MDLSATDQRSSYALSFELGTLIPIYKIGIKKAFAAAAGAGLFQRKWLANTNVTSSLAAFRYGVYAGSSYRRSPSYFNTPRCIFLLLFPHRA
jgi:hypothetical protein